MGDLKMEITEKRRATLISMTYYVFIGTAFYLFMKYAFGLVSPFLIAVAIAVMLQTPIRKISNKTKIKKPIVGAVSVLLIISVIIAAVVLVGYRLFVEFKGLGEYLAGFFSVTLDELLSGEELLCAAQEDMHRQQLSRSSGSIQIFIIRGCADT